MKIGHYVRSVSLTGGTKVIAQHQLILKSLGHEIFWFARKINTDFDFQVPIIKLDRVESISDYNLDIIITNKPKDYFEVKKVPDPLSVYLSQAYEVDHMNIRKEKKQKLEKYNSPLGTLYLNIKSWLKKRRIHKLYSEKTIKWAVSPYLMDMLKPYNAPLFLVRNSFNSDLYKSVDRDKNPSLQVLSVGDYSLSRKNMPFLFNAIGKVEKNFRFIRISPEPMTPEEKESGLADEFHSQIPEEQLAEIYQNTDILVSTSTDEGFGLPVIEAMACGALCVLSKIGAYEDFAKIDPDAPENYALFFDPRNPDELADLLKDVTNNFDKYETIRQNGMKLTSFYRYEKTVEDMEKALKPLQHSGV